MLLAVVSSKAYYGNNKTFCGLMFFLTGLYAPGTPPFVRWQLGITYFGAGLNKLLDGDWHTGVFFENWAVNRLHHSWYIALDSLLPPHGPCPADLLDDNRNRTGSRALYLPSAALLLGNLREHSFSIRPVTVHGNDFYFVLLQHVGGIAGIRDLAVRVRCR